LNFSKQNFRFSSAKNSDDLIFLVVDQKFRISLPNLPVSVHFPPDWPKLLFPPTFKNFPPCFPKIHQVFTCFAFNFFPLYFDHNAFMHHPMHVGLLDAPACRPERDSKPTTLQTKGDEFTNEPPCPTNIRLIRSYKNLITVYPVLLTILMCFCLINQWINYLK